MTHINAIHWFRHDLRLEDNPALRQTAGNTARLLCVFVVDPRWFKSSHYQSRHMGQFRWAFLIQSLQNLDARLQLLGQRLHVLYGDPVEQMANLVDLTQASLVSVNRHCGVYERQQWQRLQHVRPDVFYAQHASHALFDQAQLPFSLNDMPTTFTPFRKKVESLTIDFSTQTVNYLPPPIMVHNHPWDNDIPTVTDIDSYAQGGADAAHQQLNYYLFETHLIKDYKQTRNGLDGWHFSSKLSAWLANGCLSPKQVYWAIKRYEQDVIENESTYWLFFELLWREFFYWHAMKHEHKLFHFQGVSGKKPLTSFLPQRFAKWCAGATPYPIVNACMHQLNQTGFMSNRGRQLVASCLVHELGLDWRYGAAYFEQQLLDFDVASNYGNWQYLAGVGADPRGHRRFDLAKQTDIYDPQQQFIRQWKGHASTGPLDDVDASDWPIVWN